MLLRAYKKGKSPIWQFPRIHEGTGIPTLALSKSGYGSKVIPSSQPVTQAPRCALIIPVSYTHLSSAFFQAVSPEYAVITSDAENPEDETVVHILSSLGATVYLTRLGSVTMVSDGENLDVSQAAFSEQ